LCAIDNLLQAFLDVKRNKGAAGVDGITIEVFEARLHEELAILAKELREWRNILGDLIASLSIVMDRPFVVGDTIIVENHIGTVEHIGMKTTRIRSVGGEQIIFSNTDLGAVRLLRRHQKS
jgi:hypothetical protein